MQLWFIKGGNKSFNSAILGILVDTGHQFGATKLFKVIYQVQGNKSRTLKHHILATADAIGIHLRKPKLCSRKQHVRLLT